MSWTIRILTGLVVGAGVFVVATAESTAGALLVGLFTLMFGYSGLVLAAWWEENE